jgi:hypothetical protein
MENYRYYPLFFQSIFPTIISGVYEEKSCLLLYSIEKVY